MKSLNVWSQSSSVPDVIGIGSLNVDYIAPYSKLKRIDPSLKEELLSQFEHGSEKVVSKEKLEEWLGKLSLAVKAFHGGSALNAIHTISHLRCGISVGYVGTLGQTTAVDFKELFRRQDIDGRFVDNSETTPASRCLSFTWDGKRTLLTEDSEGGDLAAALQQVEQSLIEYLSKSRLIHVTSLVAADASDFVSRVVLEARRRSPALRISLDPGHIWARPLANETASSRLNALLAAADYVFLNEEEYKLLADPQPFEDDLDAVGRILPLSPNRQRLLVLKKYDETSLYTRLSGQILPRPYENDDPLLDAAIEDSTGAGDIFAGAFLATKLLGLDHGDCAAIASRLVRAKLQTSGSSAYSQFGELLTYKTLSEPKLMSKRPGIFISHGTESDALKKVERFIRALGLEPIIVMHSPSKGLSVDNLVERRMRESACAIILATADENVGSRLQPRPNVIHEIGLAQEMLKHKIIYLKEVGCEFPSNVSPKVWENFDQGNLEKAFEKIVKELHAFGIINTRKP